MKMSAESKSNRAIAATYVVVLTIISALSLPGVCLSFQPKASPPSPSFRSRRNCITTKTTTTTTHLNGQRQRQCQDNDNKTPKYSFNNFDFDHLADRIARQAATVAAASVLFFSVGTTGTMMMGPTLPAFAADATTNTAAVVSQSSSSSSSTPQQQQSLLLKEISPEELALEKLQQEDTSYSVVDEVWTLLDKYFIDRTFNQQDWNAVRTKVNGNKNNKQSMKVVTEMVQSLGDKYTRVLDKEQYAAIQKFDLIGVGVALMPNSQKEIIVGSPPIGGSASDKAGLQMGDFVTAVNGIPTRGRNAFDIIDQMGESPNAKTVSFSILRKDKDPFEVTMDRQTMEVKDPVQYKISETRSDGTKVGYVRVSEFNSLVNSSLQRALSELKKQGANAYVMDLRGNTGGAFQSAIEISSLFLRDRVATYVVDSNQVELPFRTSSNKLQELSIDPETPLVIWLDGMSASASEVLAGSLHDNCRAVTMGDKSFGKGLIQAVYGLKNGSGLVVTVAKYVTPSGYEIQGKGITPDILPLGKNMPAPVFVPVLSTDTSKVDFKDVAQRLSSKVCTVPEDRIKAAGATGAIAEAANVD